MEKEKIESYLKEVAKDIKIPLSDHEALRLYWDDKEQEIRQEIIPINALDNGGEVYWVPNPEIRLQWNWSMGRKLCTE